ncbi:MULTISPECIES: siroheme synthase CysG [Bradyrhizobium]|uniref:Blr1477 protein n=1 Tax=Bradyrhizobium diazoefficiens (strain JCM 10833 / BCRC 13528 / IAM 13628 / NBRC 14792 / USDA 110) TaxID=224911 RepID=Q89UE0_BRADU|nr:siroheme synthase CysG [Bradyrhizobium diazoefficiens]MBP1059742.1 uroporphyrin-III C-methyltransferase/precorrin-2 dehydrogenase/sirohydrochlorin ferrochelatase [Bradyrhizobium japonicum]AND87136.1 siroheme synthase [Bradyrhizobium diazoefficiens USDA 110]AWO88626.1 uroporphyrinogen-III C-methyltransferase [Bradyrhizobium diazoefficiens]PDT59218.1 uroporphyrinogen-III C-methyltransferase [Bradyrhizobium diazoefficiens]QBP20412.1 uroporphyrinogen-III C-methyltransferase [Bradyrhizobium diaz
MRFLPVFLDLKAGPVVLIGAGELLRAKLRVLTAAGARIRVHAIDGNQDMGLSSEDAARVDIATGDPLIADLSGVIAIVCAGAGDVGVAMSARAKALGLPVNVMDDLEHSSFIFPAIVDRGDVVVAVGTGGTSPVVARRVREKIEALLPARIGELAEFIGDFRKSINERIAEFPLRRRFWERVIDGPIGGAVLAGRKGEADAALKAIADPAAFARADKPEGSVALVGAGPGDPDLLTIKALRALQDADIVFHDELVSREILDRIRRDTTRVAVGRRVGKPGIGQDAINTRMIEAAQSGQRVVRLKGGDPFVFGRGGEEVEALRSAGVAYSIIPGITAGLGGAADFEVPLTYRHEATRITFLTAHRARDAEAVDWSTLTDTKMTVVVYMGMTAAPAVRAGLFAAGRSPETPVGVFARVTRPDAQGAIGTLRDLPELVRRTHGGPAMLIIGDVVRHAGSLRRQTPKQIISDLLDAAE